MASASLMFDDINLLPEDLRDKEKKEKEKIEKSGDFFEEELSHPPLEEKKGNGLDFKAIDRKNQPAKWEVKDGEIKKDKLKTSDKKVKKTDRGD